MQIRPLERSGGRFICEGSLGGSGRRRGGDGGDDLLLIRLIGEEGPQSVGVIARRLLLDDSTVTRQVAAMATAGLVRKEANPADARSALVHATDAGVAKAEAMRRQRFERLETLFHGWPEEDRAECARVIGRLNRSLREVLSEPATEAGKGA